ncbi:MAG: ABC transporter ATP-binding protein [Deltaproteobacteria bacterium]|nr:ABC transporter ATP-binding protein [Deltaproteobacteria bacterium]
MTIPYAIKTENLGKRYLIGRAQPTYRTLRDSLAESVKAPFRKATNLLRGRAGGAADLSEILWAARNINLEIAQGDVVGIIGKNGAGKSTLLKLIARITAPTEGTLRLRGRVGCLLEVGTGFHPELTGRENIFLNGVILGMTKAEIAAKFDEIVAFSEVEKFLDTPIKHYSSGMTVRLAFAVAAHLDPEILLVDEVLAVGDVAFQKKCMGKIGSIAKTGRTVIFVSHNMSAIGQLCKRGIWLDKGTVIDDGPAQQVVSRYLSQTLESGGQARWEPGDRPGNGKAEITSVRLLDKGDTPVGEINISEPCTVEIGFTVLKDGARAQFSVVVFDDRGSEIFASLSNSEQNFHGKPLSPGNYVSRCTLYGDLFNNGRYHVTIIGSGLYYGEGFRADHCLSFEALDDGKLRGDYMDMYGGVLRPRFAWITQRI